MKHGLSAAIEELRDQLREQLNQATETKKLINSLLKRMGEEPEFHDIGDEVLPSATVRRDQYYGKPFATAAQEYLERRKHACSPEEILQGLTQGGFAFQWKEDDRLRSLAISLAKNNQKFHKLPNGTFGLLSWYPEIAKKNGDSEE